MQTDPEPPTSGTTRSTLRRCAELARLELPDEELFALAPEFDRVLAAFEALARWPLEGTPEAAERHASLRDDEPGRGLERAALLAQAPEPLEGFFGVPKTIGGAE